MDLCLIYWINPLEFYIWQGEKHTDIIMVFDQQYKIVPKTLEESCRKISSGRVQLCFGFLER